jgi:hypothetical protein
LSLISPLFLRQPGRFFHQQLAGLSTRLERELYVSGGLKMPGCLKQFLNLIQLRRRCAPGLANTGFRRLRRVGWHNRFDRTNKCTCQNGDP